MAAAANLTLAFSAERCVAARGGGGGVKGGGEKTEERVGGVKGGGEKTEERGEEDKGRGRWGNGSATQQPCPCLHTNTHSLSSFPTIIHQRRRRNIQH